MKSKLIILISSFLFLFIFSSAFAQNKKERKAKRQKAYIECLQLIEGGEFKFEAEKAYPQGGSSIDLTTNYGFIKISENKSLGDLPFFGRAYRVDYGADGGINFEGDILNEKLTRNDKKMKLTYTFEVKDKETYTVIMEVFSKQSASTIIRTDSKAHISYSGQISELENEKSESE
ncbi:DUF4251 domain-containing protein [Ancylomarina euxinus]|uniref:DUF4251 domain-containing protein n=1 Tax=Ancylomarina euxinus TaxID=2283627 RepID=A0A425Y443_9BACT|nr:DUF4251 domain-containing protein [Ancylomarina euxinus]MCZ4694659.1 DUF4251 domain-containing protein [Ancylomarina euxinus]MUP14204.1 DUF4251 domain-containing protein [Ancylomarina euxinus]RRG23055.1 DUF4251 domain-containing protein [Ancylomarina euxinus]